LTETLERAELRKTRRNFVLALLGALGVISFLMFRPFLTYVILGGVFVYVLWPAQLALTRVVRRPGAAAGILLVIVFTIVLAPLAFISFELARTVSSVLSEESPEGVLATIDESIARLATAFGLDPPPNGTSATALAGALAQTQAWLSGHLPDLLTVAALILLGFLVMAFVIFYGLIEGESIVQYVKSVMPLTEKQSKDLFEELRRTLDAVLYGQLVLSFAAGALGAVGYALFGIPQPIFWGFVTFVFALLPVVGAPVVYVPAALWLVSEGRSTEGIALLVYGFVFLNMIEHILRPRLVGEKAQMHPFLVLVGAIGGLEVFGFVGFIVGPIVLSLLVAVLNFWRKDYLPSYEAGKA